MQLSRCLEMLFTDQPFVERMKKVIRAFKSNIVPGEKLIIHRISLDELGAGLEALRNGRAIKVPVQP
jgi:hypothetical protein